MGSQLSSTTCCSFRAEASQAKHLAGSAGLISSFRIEVSVVYYKGHIKGYM